MITNCPICSSQEEAVVNKILSVLQHKKFSKNTIIIEQEEETQGLFLIHKGLVKISKLSPNGKELVLALLGERKTFGEAGLLGQDFHQEMATAASDNCELFFIPKNELIEIITKSPKLYQSVVTSLVRWISNLNQVIETISTPSAQERVMNYLYRLQEQQQNSEVLKLEGKKHEVAMMLGLRPETFSRTLSDLEEKKLIKMNHKQITIL